jgi:branched-chain amino acid transport system ATP-binding protein
LQVADYGYVMENGLIALEGSSETLRRDPRIAETYLGIAHQAAPARA